MRIFAPGEIQGTPGDGDRDGPQAADTEPGTDGLPGSGSAPASPPGRLVLKIGSRTLTGGTHRLLADRFHRIAAEVAAARETGGIEVVLVSSGAVAAGFPSLGMTTPPTRVEDRQAAAAIGQSRLMALWSEAFEAVGLTVAQVLLTNDCITDRSRYLTSSRTLATLLERGIVPIVNENDTVSVEEITVGDNDNLAAVTAALVRAHRLILLTDVPGVFTGNPATDPEARVVPFARSAGELREHCYAKVAAESRGGMESKLRAAETAGAYGIATVITDGSDPGARQAALAGAPTGTFIAPPPDRLSAREHWMAMHRDLAAAVVVDDGAIRAIRARNSLLPGGVVDVVGHFRRGDLISVVDRNGHEHARGMVRFDALQVLKIRGLHTRDVPGVLGTASGNVIMRPDRMVLMNGTDGTV